MAFTGKEDHLITLEEAIKLIQNYKNTGQEIKAHYFGKDLCKNFLNKKVVWVSAYIMLLRKMELQKL